MLQDSKCFIKVDYCSTKEENVILQVRVTNDQGDIVGLLLRSKT